MKRFSVAIVLFIAFASVLALTKEEAKEKFKEANKKCNADPATAIDEDAVKNWREHGGEKPANSGAHAFCVSKTLGWQDENGNILRDALREKMSPQVPENKIDEFMTKCAVDQSTKEETAEHLFKCMIGLAKKAGDH